MSNNPFRMNRSVVAAQTFEQANDHVNYWRNKTEDERLNAACAIINQIFGVTPQTKVDRTILTSRKHQHG